MNDVTSKKTPTKVTLTVLNLYLGLSPVPDNYATGQTAALVIERHQPQYDPLRTPPNNPVF